MRRHTSASSSAPAILGDLCLLKEVLDRPFAPVRDVLARDAPGGFPLVLKL